jgi:hypothetical protein
MRINGGYTYDAFISYRRAQGWQVAVWLSQKLERYRPSKELLRQLSPSLRKRLQEPHRVILDTRYERSNENFWDAHIAPALRSSRRLIVISTSDAFEPRSDGAPNWVEREIETYWEHYREPERILVALAPGAPEDRYPGKLGEASEHWDWADLRGYRRLYWLLPWRAKRLEDAFSKLIAGIYDIPAEFVPILRREEQRRHSLQRSIAAIVLSIGISLSVLAYWQWREKSQRANEALANSIWSRLELGSDILNLDEVDALWQLATSELPVRVAFLKQLSENRPLIPRLARHPAPVLRAFGLKLTPEQAQVALGPVLDAMRSSTNPYTLRWLVEAAWVLSPTPGQTQAALSLVLDAMRASTDPGALGALAEVAQALIPSLGPAPAQAALGRVLDAMHANTDPDALRWLAEVVQALASRLGPAQAQVALGRVLDAMRASTDPGALGALAEAAQALSPTPEQAQAALGRVLDAMRASTDPDALEALAKAVQALASRLGPDQAQAALGRVLDALRASTDPGALGALVEAAQVLGAGLGGETKAGMLDLVRSGLGAARTSDEAAAWISAFMVALPAAPAACVEMIVGVLKYPTTALQKSPADEPINPAVPLLGSIHDVCPDAKGAATGSLADFVAWVDQTHPGIDLTGPPVRPPPLAEAIATFQAAYGS